MATTLNDINSTDWSLSVASPGKVVQGLDDISQCLWTIFTTVPGEDPLRPLFGCNALLRTDRPVNETIPAMYNDILQAASLWEPRVEITEITHELLEAHITFTVTFLVLNTQDTGQIDVTYAINSAS